MCLAAACGRTNAAGRGTTPFSGRAQTSAAPPSGIAGLRIRRRQQGLLRVGGNQLDTQPFAGTFEFLAILG